MPALVQGARPLFSWSVLMNLSHLFARQEWE